VSSHNLRFSGAPILKTPYGRDVPPEFVRQHVVDVLHRIVVGDQEITPIHEWDPDDPDPIALDSPVRVVHRDPAMFVGGVRALLFQTLHPTAMYAVAEHSDYEHDPLGRLQRTARFLGQTVYGSGADANQAIEVVRTIHSRVIGTLPDGTIYRADDPHLLGWVHATEVDSFLYAYQKYGAGHLSPAECDRYVADMGIIGAALGVEDVPQSRAELVAMLDSYRDELRATKECRDTTRFLFAPPLPIGVMPFYGLIFTSAVAMLPRWARLMLLLPVAPGIDPFVLRPAMTALTRSMRWAQVTPSDNANRTT